MFFTCTLIYTVVPSVLVGIGLSWQTPPTQYESCMHSLPTQPCELLDLLVDSAKMWLPQDPFNNSLYLNNVQVIMGCT